MEKVDIGYKKEVSNNVICIDSDNDIDNDVISKKRKLDDIDKKDEEQKQKKEIIPNEIVISQND